MHNATPHLRTTRWLVSLGLFVAFLFVLLGLRQIAAQAATPAATTTVTISDFSYGPSSATIALSDTVRWENNGAAPHTVSGSSANWNSGNLATGQNYSRTFTETGTFAYYCAIHPTMTGQIRVVLDPTRAANVYLPMLQAAGNGPSGPTGTVTATGTLWSDPNSWGGRVPGPGAAVVIPAGVDMIFDISSAPLYSLTINGSLTFADKDLNLSANWILVHGRLQIGTEQQPYAKKATITLTGQNRSEDIMGMGTKFLGAMGGGVIEIHGSSRTATSWTRLAATAEVGATQITLAEAVNWQIGDEIVIAPSGYNPREAEKVTISAVAGSTVTFAPALRYRHSGQVQTIEGRSLDTRAEVGLLTRNIVIQGDDPGAPTEDADYYPYTRGFGGHVMIMAGSQARVEGVEFRRMGQTGNKARYPMHWHFTGEGSGQYIKNSSVDGSFHRAIVTHAVKDVLVENNVVYNVVSHAFVPAEDGPETGNRFVGNLGVLNYQLNPVDYSFGPDGRGRGQQEERPGMFWLTNPNNPLIGNVVAGTLRGQGFFYDGGSFGPGFEFRNNVAHAVTAEGSGNAELLYPPSTRGYGLFVGSVDGNDSGTQYLFSGFTGYKNGLAGAWLEGPQEVLADSLLADHNLAAIVFQSPISNTLIVGQSANVTADEAQTNFGAGGILYMTGRGDKRISLQKVTFANHTAEQAALVFADEYMLTGGQVTGLRFVNTPQRLRFVVGEGRETAYGWFSDADGSLAGASGARDIAPQALDRRICALDAQLTGYVCQAASGNALGLHLRFDETSGQSASDSSPFASGGTLRGGAGWAAGKYSGALSLDGSDGWVELAPQRLYGDFSISMWVKLGNDLERQNPVLGSPADGYYRLTFEPYSWGTTPYRGRFQLRNGNVNYNLASESSLAPGTWAHVALVRQGATLRLYVNGVEEASEQNEEPMRFAAVGRHDNNYFDGQIDDLRIYDRALSTSELQAVMAGN
jgi:plastocyanin